MKKEKHINLQYNIPQLGIVNTKIFGPYAAECFNFLDKYGFIEKLKKTNQLGVIKNTLKGTHHPRWEYVVLQIYLIEQLKNTDYNSGISSNFKLHLNNSVEVLSGAELLQIWVLLLNSGHLPGTFASERGFLKYIRHNNILFNTFKRGLPKDSKSLFGEVVTKNKNYKFHCFIMLFLLERHKRYDVVCSNNKLIDVLVKALNIYIFPSEDKKLRKLKFYFNRIRQLSYLFLDSQYTAFPINFNISQFVFNIEDHIIEFFDPYSPLNKILLSFDNLLTVDLYNSEESIRELSIHSDYIFNYLNQFSEKKFRSLKFLKKLLEEDYLNFEPKIKEIDENYKTLHLTFNLERSPVKDAVVNKLNVDLEDKWGHLIGEGNLLTIQTSSNNNFITITIVFKTGNSYNHILAVSRLTKELINLKDEILNQFNMPLFDFYKWFIDNLFLDSFNKIYLFILNNSLKNKNVFFNFDESSNDTQLFCSNNNEIRDFYNENEIDDFEDSEKYEYYLTKFVAEKETKRTKSLICFSSLFLYGKNTPKNEIHEFDGSIINFKNEKVFIIFIEAKNQKNRGQQDAKRELSKKISYLGFLEEIKEVYDPKGAYTIIKVS